MWEGRCEAAHRRVQAGALVPPQVAVPGALGPVDVDAAYLQAELKDNLWKIAKFEKAIKSVRRPVACVMQAVVSRVASSPA